VQAKSQTKPRKPGSGRPKGAKDLKQRKLRKFSLADIENALRRNVGNSVAAAEALNNAEADRGGTRTVTPANIRHHINSKPELRAAVDETLNEMLDIAEGVVEKAIMAGDARIALQFLEMKGKGRGYTKRHEVGGPDNGPIRVEASGTVTVDPSEAYKQMLDGKAPPPVKVRRGGHRR
jgi:hypothetical protein